MAYTADVLEGGTAYDSGHYSGYHAGLACDNSEAAGSYWYGYPNNPNCWGYYWPAGTYKMVRKLRMRSVWVGGNASGIAGFSLYGTNDGTNWTLIYSGTQGNNANIWYEYTFANNTAYNRYQINFSGSYYDSIRTIVLEIEMMEEIIYPPNTPSTPSGNSSVVTGVSNSYSSAATDPAGRNVYYVFDWGDNSGYTSTGWYASGATGSASHAFATPGTYQVRSYAVNSDGLSSGWSSTLTVNVVSGKCSFRLVGLC